MGASSSSFAISGSDMPALKVRLGDIPESCIALVLTHLDPPEICNLARLNRAFRGASSADFIWETKLPPNYRYIAEKLFDESVDSLGKKDLYARLCRPNPFDGGTKVWRTLKNVFVRSKLHFITCILSEISLSISLGSQL